MKQDQKSVTGSVFEYNFNLHTNLASNSQMKWTAPFVDI
jgi:hypothetical protein